MLISSMDDTHLQNVINLLINKASKWYAYQQSENFITGIESHAYDFDTEHMKAQAWEMIKSAFEQLPKYIFEATIRWMNYSAQLQELTWRTGSIISMNEFQKLKAIEQKTEEFF